MLHPRFAFAAATLALVVFGCGDDEAPPAGNGPPFEGVSYVVPDSTGKLVVAWKPADGAVDYRVYVSKIQGRQLKTVPAVRTNGTSVVVAPETPNVRYFITVRAANAAGTEDDNVVEKSAVAAPDTIPPSFAGIKTAEPANNAGVKLTWDPASDDLSPPEAITYDVFARRAGGATAGPPVKIATTLPGDTSLELTQFGNPGEQFQFAARARDVAGNLSTEDGGRGSALGPDATPPTFEGCDTVTPLGSRTVTVTWKPATDNSTPARDLSYEVYVSKTSKGHDFNAPPAVAVKEVGTATLTNLDAGTNYFILCKVRDGANNLDRNENEKSVATGSDIEPPNFLGLTNAAFDPDKRTVTLEWNDASDNQTGTAAIVYDVFESKVSKTYDFETPRATSAPGAKSISLTNLASNSTLYWVVRARDQSGNRDANTVERTGTTALSFQVDVQGIFDRSCAVVGCHVTGPAAAGLNLARGFSYKALYNAPSTLKRNPTMVRVSNNGETKDSFLWLKINPEAAGRVGALMPAPETGNTLSLEEQGIIRKWIEGGALEN